MKIRRQRWNDADDQVIRDRFPAGGVAACQELLPTRTPAAIALRASELQVRRLRAQVIRAFHVAADPTPKPVAPPQPPAPADGPAAIVVRYDQLAPGAVVNVHSNAAGAAPKWRRVLRVSTVRVLNDVYFKLEWERQQVDRKQGEFPGNWWRLDRCPDLSFEVQP